MINHENTYNHFPEPGNLLIVYEMSPQGHPKSLQRLTSGSSSQVSGKTSGKNGSSECSRELKDAEQQLSLWVHRWGCSGHRKAPTAGTSLELWAEKQASFRCIEAPFDGFFTWPTFKSVMAEPCFAGLGSLGAQKSMDMVRRWRHAQGQKSYISPSKRFRTIKCVRPRFI